MKEFVAATSRSERYSGWAEMPLNFLIYRWMENFVLISFVVSLPLLWIDDGLVRFLMILNLWVVAAVGVAHHLSLAILKPWLLLAAASKAGIIWAFVALLLDLNYLEPFCVFVFVLLYWVRCEEEVSEKAYANFREALDEHSVKS
ncbi:MAG: hypothetical protein F4Z71_01125 [Gammaproteobacteria bacterium]|nr:hypothetical protein [Gammaproteobacteria bacterium]